MSVNMTGRCDGTCDSCTCPPAKEEGQVIDFAKKKHAKLVLDVFDRLEHQDRRDQSEKRSEVERVARNRL